MGDQMHHCSECGGGVTGENQMAHWDWHRALRQRLRNLEEQVAELVRERNAEIDARREASERG